MQICPAFKRGGCESSSVVKVSLDYFPTHLHNRLTSPNYHLPLYFACNTCGTSFVEYTVNRDTNDEQRVVSVICTTHTQTRATNWFNFNMWVKA